MTQYWSVTYSLKRIYQTTSLVVISSSSTGQKIMWKYTPHLQIYRNFVPVTQHTLRSGKYFPRFTRTSY